MPIGMSMNEVLFAAAPTNGVSAVLLGGYYGTWVSGPDTRWVTLDNKCLRQVGSAMGCGAIVVLPTAACGLRETARILTWLAGETAGQCGPCVHGLAAIAEGMTDLSLGRATVDTVASLERWGNQVERRGACSFPDGAVRLMRSAMKVFADDVRHHLLHGPCGATRFPPVMNIPTHRELAWR